MSELKKIIVLFLLLFLGQSFSQTGPRTWGDHLSSSNCNSITKLGKTVYASYLNGLVYFEENELNTRDLNKINGLSDVGIKLLRANDNINKLLVVYENSNLDIIDANNQIQNYPGLKLKSINGKKSINEVTFFKQFAYLACGFGIIVFDMEKLEIKETFYIGPGAANIDVRQVALNDSLIFAATESGLFYSNYLKNNLNDYRQWKVETVALPKGPYSAVFNCNKHILCAYSLSSSDHAKKYKDTLYIYSGANWKKFPAMAKDSATLGKIIPFGKFFLIYDAVGVLCREVESGNLVYFVDRFNGNVSYGNFRDAHVGYDHTGHLAYWIADAKLGVYRAYGPPFYFNTQVKRKGMHGYPSSNIDILEGRLALSPSFIGNAGVYNGIREGINFYENGEWKYIPVAIRKSNGETEVVSDATGVLQDRKVKNRVWVSTWEVGVLRYDGDSLTAVYNHSTTPAMPELFNHGSKCIGLSQDKDGNIWFCSSEQKGYLSVIKKSGEYQNFEFATGPFCRASFIDRNGYIWILHERDGGVTVFQNNKFAAPQLNINYKVLTNEVGKGNLQSKEVRCIAEDRDGKIWIGTSLGISVINNPASNTESEPIKIVQDGNVELLLSKEAVTAIAVDGADNKWIGTASGGLYCFSPDGQIQLQHFTTKNSPLYSDAINCLGYFDKTGDIFIGTEIGVQSYRSLILAGEPEYSDVIAFPNPVRPNYQGTVLVKGLIDNSIVKITDISGNLVWETKSNGGQIEWSIKNFSGTRVSSGIYTIFASDISGELKAKTKILVMN